MIFCHWEPNRDLSWSRLVPVGFSKIQVLCRHIEVPKAFKITPWRTLKGFGCPRVSVIIHRRHIFDMKNLNRDLSWSRLVPVELSGIRALYEHLDVTHMSKIISRVTLNGFVCLSVSVIIHMLRIFELRGQNRDQVGPGWRITEILTGTN